jgi:hypothetical protein
VSRIRFSSLNVDSIVRSAVDRYGKESKDLSNDELIGVIATTIYESIKKYDEELVAYVTRELEKLNRR